MPDLKRNAPSNCLWLWVLLLYSCIVMLDELSNLSDCCRVSSVSLDDMEEESCCGSEADIEVVAVRMKHRRANDIIKVETRALFVCYLHLTLWQWQRREGNEDLIKLPPVQPHIPSFHIRLHQQNEEKYAIFNQKPIQHRIKKKRNLIMTLILFALLLNR